MVALHSGPGLNLLSLTTIWNVVLTFSPLTLILLQPNFLLSYLPFFPSAPHFFPSVCTSQSGLCVKDQWGVLWLSLLIWVAALKWNWTTEKVQISSGRKDYRLYINNQCNQCPKGARASNLLLKIWKEWLDNYLSLFKITFISCIIFTILSNFTFFFCPVSLC